MRQAFSVLVRVGILWVAGEAHTCYFSHKVRSQSIVLLFTETENIICKTLNRQHNSYNQFYSYGIIS